MRSASRYRKSGLGKKQMNSQNKIKWQFGLKDAFKTTLAYAAVLALVSLWMSNHKSSAKLPPFIREHVEESDVLICRLMSPLFAVILTASSMGTLSAFRRSTNNRNITEAICWSMPMVSGCLAIFLSNNGTAFLTLTLILCSTAALTTIGRCPANQYNAMLLVLLNVSWLLCVFAYVHLTMQHVSEL